MAISVLYSSVDVNSLRLEEKIWTETAGRCLILVGHKLGYSCLFLVLKDFDTIFSPYSCQGSALMLKVGE